MLLRRHIVTFKRTLLQGAVLSLLASPAVAQSWPYWGGSKSFDRYSPLAEINAQNVKQLGLAWTRPAVDPSITAKYEDILPSEYFKGTPVMIDDVLYAPNGVGLVEAFDALTGATKWVQQPFTPTLGEAAGSSTRGLDYWSSNGEARIVVVRGDYLYALDAKTGAVIPSFGDKGRLSLRRETPDNSKFSALNGPIVVGDVIVVSGNGGGRGAGDGGIYREGAPEDVRGYDVRSGKLLWTFHVLLGEGDEGKKNWGKDSAKFVGHMGAWAPMSADLKLGHVYLSLSSPTNAYYGGHRPGNNLYANSLVALDVKTGKVAWHFQMVHHDLWDYDNASPPTLGTLKVDGKLIDAVIQPNKTGFLFVFDRKTGKPVWPIEERPVPQSKVPGEVSSPTQPFPTKPAPFDRQGITPEDLIDFTPELRAGAKEIASRYQFGELFTPPLERGASGPRGVLSAPGAWGSGNWNTGAFDPETGWYYAISMTLPGAFALEKKDADPKATIEFGSPRRGPDDDVPGQYGIGPVGLPLLKPPYGRITAYDLNKGDKMWMVANGDGPRDHPALKGLNLPPLGTIGRPVPLVTKTLLFLGESSDAIYGRVGRSAEAPFRAYDKKTGAVVWETTLPAGTTGGPITYAVKGKQMIVVPVGNKKVGGGWVALTLGSAKPAVMAMTEPPPLTRVAAFSDQQMKEGAALFAEKCAGCHGVDMSGGEFGPSLKSENFWQQWVGMPARRLYSRIISTMPIEDPGSLTPAQTLALTALIARENGAPSQPAAVTAAASLNTVKLEKTTK